MALKSVMQNLKKNWLAVWKMTWRTWQFFITTLESVKISTFMRSFCPKLKMHELKICRGAMSNDTEERWKIWRGIDLSFQNQHKECHEFWLKYSKVLKKLRLKGYFWRKYIMSELKRYRGLTFHDTREWCKIWRKTNLWFGKKYEEFGKFSPEHLKVSKLGYLWCTFIQSIIRA